MLEQKNSEHVALKEQDEILHKEYEELRKRIDDLTDLLTKKLSKEKTAEFLEYGSLDFTGFMNFLKERRNEVRRFKLLGRLQEINGIEEGTRLNEEYDRLLENAANALEDLSKFEIKHEFNPPSRNKAKRVGEVISAINKQLGVKNSGEQKS